VSTPRAITSKDSLTVVLGGKTYSIKKGDPNFETVHTMLEDPASTNWDKLETLVSKGRSIEKWSNEDFKFSDNSITYKGDRIPTKLHNRMHQMAQKGDDPTSLMNFWERLKKNPSYRSGNQLFDFLNRTNSPIDVDGMILAYKGVRADFMDCHSGQYDNSPGQEHSMDRNKISDDPEVSCDEGFHVGSLSYATGFGAKTVVCKVDPENVVCVPKDSSQGKMRMCAYEVIGHHGAPLSDTVHKEEEYEELPDDAIEPVIEEPTEGDTGRREMYMEWNMERLRQFAQTIGIKGARRILGGKKALVARIIEFEM